MALYLSNKNSYLKCAPPMLPTRMMQNHTAKIDSWVTTFVITSNRWNRRKTQNKIIANGTRRAKHTPPTASLYGAPNAQRWIQNTHKIPALVNTTPPDRTQQKKKIIYFGIFLVKFSLKPVPHSTTRRSRSICAPRVCILRLLLPTFKQHTQSSRPARRSRTVR